MSSDDQQPHDNGKKKKKKEGSISCSCPLGLLSSSIKILLLLLREINNEIADYVPTHGGVLIPFPVVFDRPPRPFSRHGRIPSSDLSSSSSSFSLDGHEPSGFSDALVRVSTTSTTDALSVESSLHQLAKETVLTMSPDEKRTLVRLPNHDLWSVVPSFNQRSQILINRMIMLAAGSKVMVFQSTRVIWSVDEDKILEELVTRNNNDKIDWKRVAYSLATEHLLRLKFQVFPQKTNRQCQQRWSRVLAPNFSRRQYDSSTHTDLLHFKNQSRIWTTEEDQELLARIREYESQQHIPWSRIAHEHSSQDLTDLLCRSRFRQLTRAKQR